MKMKTSKAIILTIIAVLLACYILFPFALVVLNSFKTQAAIVQDPISAAGASFKQFISNLNADELATRYGERTASRILDAAISRAIVFDGESLRVKKEGDRGCCT